MKTVKTTSDLRTMLLECIDDVRQERIDPKKANSVASLAGHVLQSAKLDLAFYRQVKSVNGGSPAQLTAMKLK